MKKQLHIIALGGGGCNALEYIHKQGIQARFTYIDDLPRPHLPKEIEFIPLDLNANLPKICGYVYIRLSDMNLDFTLPEEILDLFRENQKYVLLAGLGGITGTNLTEKLILWLSQNGKDLSIICSLPYSFEGPDRYAFADGVRKKFQSTPGFNFFNLKSLRKKYGNMTLRDAFLNADKEFYVILNKELGLSGKTM